MIFLYLLAGLVAWGGALASVAVVVVVVLREARRTLTSLTGIPEAPEPFQPALAQAEEDPPLVIPPWELWEGGVEVPRE